MADSTVEDHPLIHRDFINNKGNEKTSTSFRIVQYNILADLLSTSGPQENFCKVPPKCLEWAFRSKQLLKQILSFEADIICLEEVDHFADFFQPKLSAHGYEGYFLPKKSSPCLRYPNNHGPDGLAIFFKSSRYILKENVEKYLKEESGEEGNNPLIVSVLEDKNTLQCTAIGLTHLKAKRGFEERRKAQSECAVEILKETCSRHENSSLLFCGDFNGEPGEPFYKFLQDAGFTSAFVDVNGSEPEFTTWKIRPTSEERHTIDYVWQQGGPTSFNVKGVLNVMADDVVPAERFPSFGQPSDHIPLCFEFDKN